MTPREREPSIGEALAKLNVPEHGPRFFTALDEELDALDAAAEVTTAAGAAAVAGAAIDTRGATAAETAAATETAAERTAPKRLDRRGIRRRRLFRRVALASLGVAAVVVVLALFAAFGDRWGGPDTPLAPGIASAAEVKEKVTQAIEQAETLRGTLIVVEALKNSTGAQRLATTWSFVATARGDFRLSGTNETLDGSTVREERAFDVGRRIELGYSIDESRVEGTIAWRRTGLAAGAPDQTASDLFRRQLGALVRALVEAQDPSVRETTYENRLAWTVEADFEPNRLAEGSPDHIEVTVDQETGFPVKVVETAEGQLVREVRLEGLEINPELPPDTFALALPDGAEVYEHELGFEEVRLEEAAAVVGYTPVLPAWLPDGYELASVTVAREAYPTGKEGGNPESRNVVSVSYRRGFDVLVVSTREVGPRPADWSDPLSLGEGFIDRPEKVVLTAGEFEGTTAELMLDPRGVPHLWTLNEHLVLTVSGALTRSELIRVAESVGPVE